MQNYCFRFLLAGLLYGLATGLGYAKTLELSLDQALATFYQRNLDLIAAQYNIDQAQADAVIAAAIPNPSLGVQVAEISQNPNMGSAAVGCNHSSQVSCGPAEIYSFSQLIEVAGKRGLRIESSGFATQAAESDFRDAVRIFSNLVTDIYYDLVQAQQQQRLAKDIVEHYQQIIKAHRLRLNSGDIAETEFLRVKLEATRSEADLDNAQASLSQAQAKLAWVLRWPESGLELQALAQWPEIQTVVQSPDPQQLISQALNQRPDLHADKQRLEQAQKQLELARRLKYPDVTVNGGYARDPSNNALNSFFVGVNLPLPVFYQYQGEADKAAVKLNQTRLAVEQTELTIRNEVLAALATWQSADKILSRFKEGLLSDAEAIRRSAELAYSKGATSVLDLIEAERSYKTVMHDYYNAQINQTNAYYDLAKSLAESLPKPLINPDSVSHLNQLSAAP